MSPGFVTDFLMRWSISKPDSRQHLVEADRVPMEQAVRRSLVLSRLEDLLAWGRKNSIWPFNFGLSCCYVEMATQVRSIPEIGSCNEPITDFSQFQPTRRQLVCACEFLNGWTQTHALYEEPGRQK